MPNPKLTSIIILAWNQLGYTRACIESIRKFTQAPYELILVDNGSRDATGNYLQTIPGAKVIRNKENQGFARGCNQGIRLAEGDYILLLNNDTVVAPRWLENLTICLESAPSVGLVGPRSNCAGGPQFISVYYPNLRAAEDFARNFNRESNPSQWFELDMVVGFCMLIKREVVEKIGLLDETFGLGNFEDNDYCRRAKGVGYKILCAGDTFVHHFGNCSFIGNKVDYNKLFQENYRKYKAKWGE